MSDQHLPQAFKPWYREVREYLAANNAEHDASRHAQSYLSDCHQEGWSARQMADQIIRETPAPLAR